MAVRSKDHQALDHQALRLAEIGSQLKRLREEQDVSLYKINQITLISQRHLRAIEEGNINSLPEPVYIKSFIRKYADVLGVENIADQFPLTNTAPKTKWLKSSEFRPLHLYLIYIVVISASVGALANLFNPATNNYAALNNSISESETQLSDAAKLKPNPSNKSGKKPSVTKAQNQPLSQPKPTQIKPVNIGIKMKGESWMRVEVDGQVKFEGILTEGTNRVWAADKNIVVRAGNAAAVLLEFNQYPPQSLGQAGEVVQKTFNPTYKPQALTTMRNWG
jgi:cytoskeletal protein RodZ